jgi:hypothetical protein
LNPRANDGENLPSWRALIFAFKPIPARRQAVYKAYKTPFNRLRWAA